MKHNDAIPDMITIAKGMGSGAVIGAVITRRDIAESFSGKMWFNTCVTQFLFYQQKTTAHV
jgi:4-aminobutyrate aminotransferase-like enzyme